MDNECLRKNLESSEVVFRHLSWFQQRSVFRINLLITYAKDREFLPNLPSALDTNRRVKRGVLDYGNAFLSDILKKLSIELYQFKRIRMQDNIDFRTIEASENKIGSYLIDELLPVISDMLRFSDCKNESICGFAEFGRPQKPQDRSCVYVFLNFWYFHDDQMDKQWFVKALLLQVSRDCAMYHCVKNNKAWSQLYLDFYNLDENWQFDDRSVAALAYMGTNATSEIMRIKMIEEVNSKRIVYYVLMKYAVSSLIM
uniref:SET domain-containing protein n=1 Tax=Heterorhabditis bacteriophora TaxID=37862 RepID=A0A1I7W6V0_HETBA